MATTSRRQVLDGRPGIPAALDLPSTRAAIDQIRTRLEKLDAAVNRSFTTLDASSPQKALESLQTQIAVLSKELDALTDKVEAAVAERQPTYLAMQVGDDGEDGAIGPPGQCGPAGPPGGMVMLHHDGCCEDFAVGFPSSPTVFEDPSAFIGMAAVTGTAVTAMRSDAAPALATTLVTPGADSFSLSTASDLGDPATRGSLTFTAGDNNTFVGCSLVIGGAGSAAGVLTATSGGVMTLTAGTSATMATATDLTLQSGNDIVVDSANSTNITSGGNVLVTSNQTEWNIATSATINAESLNVTTGADTLLTIDGNLAATVGSDATVEVNGEFQCIGQQNMLFSAVNDLSLSATNSVSLSASVDVDVVAVAGQVIIGGETGIRLQSLSGTVFAQDASLQVITPGKGLDIAEGTDARSGLATLVAGTVTVATAAVTANSRIQLTAQNMGTITVPAARDVSARTPGVDFTILSADPTDTSDIAWLIIEDV